MRRQILSDPDATIMYGDRFQYVGMKNWSGEPFDNVHKVYRSYPDKNCITEFGNRKFVNKYQFQPAEDMEKQ
jgi:hypothetical protein